MAESTASRISLGKKQHRAVSGAIEHWRQSGLIDPATASRLSGSLALAGFDWRRTARYAFIVSIICLVIALGAALADRVLMALLERIFNAPAALKCAGLAVLSAAIFRYGLYLRGRHPERVYRNEAVFFLGVLALAGAVLFFGRAVDTGSGHYSLLFLFATLLYAALGLAFPSKLVWVFGLFALGAWMGTETGYVSGHGMYFLGMNYPLRFVVFGAALTALGMLGERSTAAASTIEGRLASMAPQTKAIGLLNLFIALWIMSIFGNYGDMYGWHRARQYELLHWALLFGAVALAAIWYGLRHDDGMLRGFGLTFLFINLYTRFFEYLWDSLHKAVFFAVLAVSFWYLGSKAETLWHLGRPRLRSS